VKLFDFVCGLAVLFCTLGYFHIIHHYSREALRDGGTPGLWLAIAFATVIGALSAVGGCLLVRRSRG
jgi:hypothetical protein